MSNCQSCSSEHLCVYEFKPCACFDMRKFKPHPDIVACADCDNTGYKPYPLKCKTCNGTGAVIKDK